MPSFRYRAIGPDGAAVSGELDAESRSVVVARLHAQGSLPLRVAPTQTGAIRRLLARDILARDRVSRKDVADLIQRLASLQGGGIAIEEALAITGGREGAAKTQRVVQEMLRRLRDGAQLADALAAERRAFPPIVVGMVRAGETSGTLAPTLARLGDYLQRSEEVRQTVQSALIYPAILLITAFGSVLMVLTVVLPALQPLLEDAGTALPLPTRLAFAASGAVRQHWWVMLLAVVVAGVVGQRALADPAIKARRDAWLLRVPFVGTVLLRAEVARFTRTLGSLIAGGVSLPAAMALAHPVTSNAVVRDAVAQVTIRIREGGGLAEPLARTAVFPDLAIQMIRIGEATGRLDTMLLQLADIFDSDVRRAINRGLALLVPALTIGLGLLVAGIIASVMLAILSINDMVH